MVASFDLPELPSLRERLPELTEQILSSLKYLEVESRPQMPAWDAIYQKAHTLKGLINILPCDQELADSLEGFTEFFSELCRGKYDPNNPRELRTTLNCIVEALQRGESIAALVQELLLNQKTRVAFVGSLPFSLPFPDPRVSRRWEEAQDLGYVCFFLEEEIPLAQVVEWRKKLMQLLADKTEGHAFIIHSLPFVFSEGTRLIRIWAACASPRAIDLTAEFPKARSGSL